MNLALEELQECISDGKKVEEHLEQKVLTDAITAFLQGQPEHKRIIFLQRYFYLYQMKEISQKLGMKEGTVKSILSRMRRDLQIWLEKEEIYL